MLALILALLTMPYWIFFVFDLFYDVHLTYYITGVLLKSLLPFAIVCNVVGCIAGIISLAKKSGKKKLTLITLVLNSIPLGGILFILYWWMFIFKM